MTSCSRRASTRSPTGRGNRLPILDGLASRAEAFAACHTHLSEALAGVVARAHEQGTLRRDVDAGDVGLQILALSGVAQLAPDEETLRRHVGLMLDGLRHDKAL